MATVLDPASLRCESNDERPAVAFSRWPVAPNELGAWVLLCRQCIKHAEYPNGELVYLDGHQPPADHPGHVHVRYADNISADHPTDI